jgi:preprotein translocase subunit YajC
MPQSAAYIQPASGSYSMFVTDAYAQTAAPGGGLDMFGLVFPMILVMGVFYFFLIRPQQQKMKQHQEMVSKAGKGDTVVTSGGLIGKVVKVVDDNELLVEIGENVKVRVLRSGLSDVRVKGS